MKKKTLMAISCLLLVGAGCSNSEADVLPDNSNTTTATTTVAAKSNIAAAFAAADSTDKAYSLAEVAKHGTAGDCWLAVNGSVYNVTSYIQSGKHPGGPKIIQGCGKDAAQLFQSSHIGEKQDKALSVIKNYYIGKLK